MKIIAAILVAFVLTACATVQDTINEKRNAVFLIMAEKVNPETNEQGGGFGTGFFIGENEILTNAHVVSGASKLQVKLESGQPFDAEVVHIDEQIDLALIKIKDWEKFSKENDIVILTLANSSDIKPMDEVYALGNPWGLTYSVSKGIVSHPMRKHDAIPKFLIQTDADVYQGNSGGPLLNTKGEVLGVNSLMYSREGGSYGFAIHSDIIKKVLNDWKENGQVKWATLGVTLSDDNIIEEVVKDSPAEKSGLQKNDKILGVQTDQGKYRSESSLETIFILAKSSTSGSVYLTVERDEENLTMKIDPVYKSSTEFK